MTEITIRTCRIVTADCPCRSALRAEWWQIGHRRSCGILQCLGYNRESTICDCRTIAVRALDISLGTLFECPGLESGRAGLGPAGPGGFPRCRQLGSLDGVESNVSYRVE